jgi:hypothetical protein
MSKAGCLQLIVHFAGDIEAIVDTVIVRQLVILLLLLLLHAGTCGHRDLCISHGPCAYL